jgi:hypothetical protein
MCAKRAVKVQGELRTESAIGPLSSASNVPVSCFVSMSFDQKRLRVWTHGINQIRDKVKGYTIELNRLDLQPWSERIIEHNVKDAIRKSTLVLADMSVMDGSKCPNPSVMHEIGFASGLDIPVILFGAKGTYDRLPANFQGSIVVEYDPDHLEKFAIDLADQVKKVLDGNRRRIRGEYTVQCFTERDSIRIPERIRNATEGVQIITTNLEYTNSKLKDAIRDALETNKSNPRFKVEMLTMDPEGDTTSARAAQLGRKTRQYRDELRQSLDEMRAAFSNHPKVEIVTYTSLPTQITFVIDDVIITSVISFGQQARGNLHIVLGTDRPRASESFLAHFRAMKALAVAGSPPG